MNLLVFLFSFLLNNPFTIDTNVNQFGSSQNDGKIIKKGGKRGGDGNGDYIIGTDTTP